MEFGDDESQWRQQIDAQNFYVASASKANDGANR